MLGAGVAGLWFPPDIAKVGFLVGAPIYLLGVATAVRLGVRIARRTDHQRWEGVNKANLISLALLLVGGSFFTLAALLVAFSSGPNIALPFVFLTGVPFVLVGLVTAVAARIASRV